MDVTSLLNSNPTTSELLKRDDGTISRAPSRNRTPWDAGGYSLPIITAPHVIRTPQSQQDDRPEIRHMDLRINTPPSSPKHRFSDSRSSLSSFASSLQSATTHSRYSSTSTLNSNFHAHHKSHGTDILSPELRSISQALKDSATLPLAIESYEANDSRQTTSLSPNECPLEQLALVAECHSSEMRSEDSRRSLSEVKEIDGTDLAPESGLESTAFNRPGSPSDAILIKRTSIPSLRVNTENLGGHLQPISFINTALDRQRPSLLQHKTHKRTWSEPNSRPTTTSSFVDPVQSATLSIPSHQRYSSYSFAHRRNTEKSPSVMEEGTPTPPLAYLNSKPAGSANTVDVISSPATANATQNIAVGPQAEPTPPPSHHPDDSSPTSPPTNTKTVPILASCDNTQAITLAPLASTHTIVCMYVSNCDTGSQLRKAISHIFGRNKMCTRQIPDEVWVFYCRKHYQRVRYRNPKHYAQLQCMLVQEQLKRINDWSEDNRRNNRRSGIVLDWSLAVRKREKERHEKKKRQESSKKRKREEADADHDEDHEENDNDVDDHGSEISAPLTAVPDWLRLLCNGQKYDTKQVLEIFNRLHREILEVTGSINFPDLEILPNILVDHDTPKSPKGYNKRPSTTAQPTGNATHRRSVSMTSVPSSQHSSWESEASIHHPPMHDPQNHQNKKRRPSSGNNVSPTDHSFPHHLASRPRMPQQVDYRRPLRQPFSQLEGYPKEIPEEFPEEHAGYDGYGAYGGPQDGHYPRHPHTRYARQVPLAAPVPQRSMRNSTTFSLEQGSGFDRYQHGRSLSDAGFVNGEPGYMQHLSPYQRPNPYIIVPYHGMRPREQAYPTGRPIDSRAPPPYPPPPYASDPHVQHPAMSDIGRPDPRTHIRHQSTPAYGSAPAVQQPQQSSALPSTPRGDPPRPTSRVTEDEKSQQLFRDRR